MDVFEVRKLSSQRLSAHHWPENTGRPGRMIMNGYGVVFLSVTYLGLVSSC